MTDTGSDTEMPSWLWSALVLAGIIVGASFASGRPWWWGFLAIGLGCLGVPVLGMFGWVLWKSRL